MNTNIKDSNGQSIYSGDKVHVSWLEDIGITELDLEASGIVKYMSDNRTAAFFVEFDRPICRVVMEEGVFECERIMLLQAGDDEGIKFTVLNI